jgi:heavy metal sensor kinase
MARPLSIGAKLALRYTAAMAVTTTVFGWVVYEQVERRINREAALLVDVRLRDLADAYESQSREHSRERVLDWMVEHTRSSLLRSEPDLGLGIELLDTAGDRVIAAGSLEGAELPLPRDLLDGRRAESLRAVNLGGRHAHLAAAEAVTGGFVRVAIDTTRYAENVESVRRILLFSLPIVIVMTAASGWYLASQSLKPIAAINATARRIGGANLREAVPVTGSGDELDALAATLNDMLARIREGVGRMQRFNANAAHQLRTPLAALRSEVDVTLERTRSAEAYRDALHDVRETAGRMAEAVDAMLRLSRSEAGLDPEERQLVDLPALLDEVLEFFQPLADERGIGLVRGAWDARPVLGEPSWLNQLFANLVSNALQYSKPGCRVEVAASRSEGGTRVRVADDGPGIDAATLETLFERFARGNGEAGAGFGLGLPIAREIAKAHGGTIEVESEVGTGTVFRVWLPEAPPGEGDR